MNVITPVSGQVFVIEGPLVLAGIFSFPCGSLCAALPLFLLGCPSLSVASSHGWLGVEPESNCQSLWCCNSCRTSCLTAGTAGEAPWWQVPPPYKPLQARRRHCPRRLWKGRCHLRWQVYNLHLEQEVLQREESSGDMGVGVMHLVHPL